MLWSLLSIISLIILSFVFIQFSFVQTYLAQRVAAYFSSELGVHVSVGRLSISPLLNISLYEVEMEDEKSEKMFYVENIYAFVTNVSMSNRSLDFSKLTVISPEINVRKYAGDTTYNFQFLLDYFKSPDDTESRPWKFNFGEISLIGARLSHIVEDKINDDENSVDFNNINVRNLNVSISDFRMQEDTIALNLTNFSLFDSSGFYIRKMNANVLYTNKSLVLNDVNVQTFNSDIHFQLALKYESPDDFSDFFHKMNLNFELKPSKINTQDVAFFMPGTNLFTNSFVASAFIKGKIKHLLVRNLIVKYGNNTQLIAKATVDGLPNLNETFIDFNIENFSTIIPDIQNFNLPNNEKINIPSNLFSAKNIKLKGIFTGFISDFVINANLQTAAGTIITDINLKTKDNKYEYQGKLATENFNPGLFIKDLNQIADLTMTAELKGKGNKIKTIQLEYEAVIQKVLLQDKTSLSNINLLGNLENEIINAQLDVDDPNLKLSLEGSLGFKTKEEFISAYASVSTAKLSKLNLTKRAPDINLNTEVRVDLKGNNIDNLFGTIHINDLNYFERKKQHHMDQLVLTSGMDVLGMRSFFIKSDWVDADIVGKFSLSDFEAIFQSLMSTYFPIYAEEEIIEDVNVKKIMVKKEEIPLPIENRYFSFDIILKKPTSIFDLFMPSIAISDMSSISGFVNAKNKTVNINFNTDFVAFSQLQFDKVRLNTKTLNDRIKIDLKSDVFHISKSENIFLKNISIEGDVIQNKLAFHLGWNGSNNQQQNNADISGEMRLYKDFVEADIFESDIVINDSTWVIENGNSFVFSENSYQISKLLINSKNKYVFINGTVSKDPEKTLNIELKNIDLSEVDPLTALRQFDLDGVLNGKLEIVDALNRISFIANLNVKNLGLNNQRLGDADFVSVWDPRKNGLFINGEVIYRGNVGENRPVAVQGYYYPSNDSLDIAADLVNFRLKTIEPYLSVILYKLDGFASGKLYVVGTLKKPELVGNLKLMRTTLGLKELNTEYTINHNLIIERNGFKFENVEIFDIENNVGVLNGYVSHKNFRDFYIDLSVRANSLMALNTNQTQSDLFYGRVFGTGLVTIKGPVENIVINAQVSSERNTEMFIPISYSTSVSENSFIRFVTADDKAMSKVPKTVDSETSGVQMNFLINVNPNARFTIFLDPSTGGTIRGSGNGVLRMEANTGGEFNMYGVYTVTEGEYMMTLKDVINKKFLIEDGGTIRWNGDPTDADIDLKAVYRTRASIASLTGSDSTNTSSQASSRRIPVNSELYLSGKLMNPTVNFGISLPSADNYTKSMFYNLLDTTNDQSMIRQTFSLLIFGRFENENTQYGNMVGEGLGSSSVDMVTSQLSSLISQYSKGLDIGVNYRQGDDMYSEEIQVNMSTELFNDRLIIDGNLGVGGQNVYQQNANQIVGDVKIEYKVTKDGRIRLRAFNQQNNNEFTNLNAPYTQGIALVYRKDFNKFRDLFKWCTKKKKTNKKKKIEEK